MPVSDIQWHVSQMMGGKKSISRQAIYNIWSRDLRKTKKTRPRRGGFEGYFNEARLKKLDDMTKQKQSDPECDREITVGYLKWVCRFKCSRDTAGRAVRKLGWVWRRPQKFADLTSGERKARRDFCQKYMGKSVSYLQNFFGCVLDEKKWASYRQASRRLWGLRNRIRGVYVKNGQKHKTTRPGEKNAPSRGGSLNVCGGILGDKVVLWDYYDKLNVATVCDLVGRAAKKHGFSRVTRDNHSTHISPKVEKKLQTKFGVNLLKFLPKKSPEPNPLDFAVWMKLERLVQLQDRRSPLKSSRESKKTFCQRLKPTALKMGIKNIWVEFKARLRRCYESGGGPFPDS